jgi:hypothetical protein
MMNTNDASLYNAMATWFSTSNDLSLDRKFGFGSKSFLTYLHTVTNTFFDIRNALKAIQIKAFQSSYYENTPCTSLT